jgi:hypothetical protein
MIVERTEREVIIRMPAYVNYEGIQKMIDLMSLREANAQSVATQEDIDILVREVNKGWWEENRNRYIK